MENNITHVFDGLEELGFGRLSDIPSYGRRHKTHAFITVRTPRGKTVWGGGFEGKYLIFDLRLRTGDRGRLSSADSLQVSPLTDPTWKEEVKDWIERVIPKGQELQEKDNELYEKQTRIRNKRYEVQESLRREFPLKNIEVFMDGEEVSGANVRVSVNLKGLDLEQMTEKLKKVFDTFSS